MFSQFVSELFGQFLFKIKEGKKLLSVCSVLNYLQGFMKSYTFLIFSGFLVVTGTFCFFYVPETKGKTIEENKKTAEEMRPRWI